MAHDDGKSFAGFDQMHFDPVGIYESVFELGHFKFPSTPLRPASGALRRGAARSLSGLVRSIAVFFVVPLSADEDFSTGLDHAEFDRATPERILFCLLTPSIMFRVNPCLRFSPNSR